MVGFQNQPPDQEGTAQLRQEGLQVVSHPAWGIVSTASLDSAERIRVRCQVWLLTLSAPNM